MIHSISAVQNAWALYRQPVLLRSPKIFELHEDMLELIKIAAGDETTTAKWIDELITDRAALQDAAAFYLQQMIGKSGNDAYRTLGLPADADPLDIKNHKRWLLKWLHPDRNPNVWQQSLYRRVTSAAVKIDEQQAGLPDDKATVSQSVPRSKNDPRQRKRHHLNARLKPVLSWRQLFIRAGKRIALLAGFAAVFAGAYGAFVDMQGFSINQILSFSDAP